MGEQKVETGQPDPAPSGSDSQARQRSTIAFPYMDLGAAHTLAKTLHDKAGNDQCSLTQLAAWMQTTTTSSTFRVQIAATRLFGLIDSEGPENYRLSPLGRRIVDPTQEGKAKVDAFLNVPLFNALYQSHKDGILPPAAALEREIAGLGASEKQKDRARQVFERSAELAGYFEHGRNRLVPPMFKTASPDGQKNTNDDEGKGGKVGGGNVGGEDTGLDLDPLLMALLVKIPKVGEKWPDAARLRWFRTFAMNVSQVYDDPNSPVELEIKLLNLQPNAQGGANG